MPTGQPKKLGHPGRPVPAPPLPPAQGEQPPKYLHRHAQIQVLTHPRGTGDIRFLKISSGPRAWQIIQSPWVPAPPPRARGSSPPPAGTGLAPTAGEGARSHFLGGAPKDSPWFSTPPPPPPLLSGCTGRGAPSPTLATGPHPRSLRRTVGGQTHSSGPGLVHHPLIYSLSTFTGQFFNNRVFLLLINTLAPMFPGPHPHCPVRYLGTKSPPTPKSQGCTLTVHFGLFYPELV